MVDSKYVWMAYLPTTKPFGWFFCGEVAWSPTLLVASLMLSTEYFTYQAHQKNVGFFANESYYRCCVIMACGLAIKYWSQAYFLPPWHQQENIKIVPTTTYNCESFRTAKLPSLSRPLEVQGYQEENLKKWAMVYLTGKSACLTCTKL